MESDGHTPQLDSWIDDVGEGVVAAIVGAAKVDIENGSNPGFIDSDALAAYMSRRQHRPS